MRSEVEAQQRAELVERGVGVDDLDRGHPHLPRRLEVHTEVVEEHRFGCGNTDAFERACLVGQVNRIAGIDLVADWPEDVLKDRPLDAYTALVAVTHDPKIDDFPLMQALRTGCFYVGALGSRKTHAKRIERLKEAGIGDIALSRIAAPIGLDIGAASPAEIAVAILAQVIQAFRRRDLRNAGGEAP